MPRPLTGLEAASHDHVRMTAIDLAFAAGVLAVGVLSGATAAVVGFGIGSLMTPLLLMRVEPHLAVTLVALPHALATALRYVQHRDAVDRRVLVRFGMPSAAGGLAGAALQSALRSQWLVVVLGGLLIATGVMNLRRGAGARRPGTAVAASLGGLSGFFGGLAGNQGGLRAAGLMAFPLEPRVFLATSTAVALVVDVARTPIYLVRSAELTPFLPTIAIATVGCLVGTVLGERLFLGLPPERYRMLVGVAVILVGVWLCVQSFA
jgi:uncharacterized membrane protein YfcA